MCSSPSTGDLVLVTRFLSSQGGNTPKKLMRRLPRSPPGTMPCLRIDTRLGGSCITAMSASISDGPPMEARQIPASILYMSTFFVQCNREAPMCMYLYMRKPYRFLWPDFLQLGEQPIIPETYLDD